MALTCSWPTGPRNRAHWEIYSIAGSGNFSAYLPGFTPDVIDSGVAITDGAWHELAMIYEPARAIVCRWPASRGSIALTACPCAATRPGPTLFCQLSAARHGLRRAARRSSHLRGVREIAVRPQPHAADDATIGLWHFDKPEADAFADASSLHNKAVIESAAAPTPLADAIVPGEGTTDITAVDEPFETVLLDRSRTESFLAVKADSEGRRSSAGARRCSSTSRTKAVATPRGENCFASRPTPGSSTSKSAATICMP